MYPYAAGIPGEDLSLFKGGTDQLGLPSQPWGYLTANTEYKFDIFKVGPTITIYVNEELKATVTDGSL